ncbi:MAG: phage holin family protein [Actinobacteria bacterium]|nr:phage holin family protein [Actinomycetota bacterium]
MSAATAGPGGRTDGPTGPAAVPLRDRFGGRSTVGPGPAAKAVAADVSALVRAEVSLAKAELRQVASRKAAGAAALAVAAVLAWLAVHGLLLAAGFALALVMPGWAAALVVSVVLLLAAAVAGLVGRRRLAGPAGMDVVKRSVSEDVEWTKQHLPAR